MAWIAGKILLTTKLLQERSHEKTADIADIALETRIERANITESARALIQAGLLERVAPGRFRVTASGLIALDQGQSLTSGPRGAMPRQSTDGLRARAWGVMRMQQKFSIRELMDLVCDGIERDGYSNLRKYVRALRQAGYLAALPRRGRDAVGRYWLQRNHGPHAPVWRVRSGCVFDPNNGEEYPLEEIA